MSDDRLLTAIMDANARVPDVTFLGLIGRPALPGAAALAALDRALEVRSYVAGFAPSAEDEAVFKVLVAAGHADASKLASAGLAGAARWYAHVASFSLAERASWPLTYQQLTSGAFDARASVLFSHA